MKFKRSIMFSKRFYKTDCTRHSKLNRKITIWQLFTINLLKILKYYVFAKTLKIKLVMKQGKD